MSSIIRGSDNFDTGSTGPVTTRGAVGSYTTGGSTAHTGTQLSAGGTASGSTLGQDNSGTNKFSFRTANYMPRFVNHGLSGTWRCMAGDVQFPNTSHAAGTLWCRIS